MIRKLNEDRRDSTENMRHDDDVSPIFLHVANGYHHKIYTTGTTYLLMYQEEDDMRYRRMKMKTLQMILRMMILRILMPPDDDYYGEEPFDRPTVLQSIS